VWGFDAAEVSDRGTATLAVLEGDAVEHVEEALGRRVEWRRMGVGLREAVGRVLSLRASVSSQAKRVGGAAELALLSPLSLATSGKFPTKKLPPMPRGSETERAAATRAPDSLRRSR
jgi:hypothetical protein